MFNLIKLDDLQSAFSIKEGSYVCRYCGSKFWSPNTARNHLKILNLHKVTEENEKILLEGLKKQTRGKYQLVCEVCGQHFFSSWKNTKACGDHREQRREEKRRTNSREYWRRKYGKKEHRLFGKFRVFDKIMK